MEKPRPKFAVIGTGNSGQTFAADIALKGYSVNLAEVPAFEGVLRAIKEKGGIHIQGDASQGFARLDLMTTDLRAAVDGVDVIIIGGSAHAHEPLSKALMPHFRDGQFVLFTSNFAALRFRRWLREAGVTTRVTPVESMSLLYATRAVEPGEVACIGVKDHLPVAALPATQTQAFLDLVAPVFPQFVAAENVWVTSLNNLNPIVHPPMVLFNAGRIESTGGRGWNLYADGATESVAKVMLAMDTERMALMEPLGVRGIPFKEAFETLYRSYALGKKSLSETLRQSPIHGNPAFPAPSTVNTRYINEDLPFGLAPWAAIGRMWDVPTPTIDALLQIAGIMLDVDFAAQGISLQELGIQGLSPEQVQDLL